MKNIHSQFNKAPKKVLAVGSLTLDDIGIHTKLDNLDSKIQADDAGLDLGGGALNYGFALQTAAQSFNTPLELQIVTKKGLPRAPEDNTRKEKNRARTQRYAHMIVDDILEEENITLIDTMEGQENDIPFNRVIEHSQGRLISMSFKQSTKEFLPETVRKIEEAAAQADLVFVHTRYPRQSLIAAKAAHAAGVPVQLDYSVTEENWEKNTEFRSAYEDLLRYSTYVAASADTVIGSDMKPNPNLLNENADELIRRMRDFGVEYIAISDGTNPVKIVSQNVYTEISIAEYNGNIFALGVGDTRNAGLSLGLIQNRSFVNSVRMGSAVASYKVRSPGRDWMDNFTPKDVANKNEITIQRPTNNELNLEF